MAGKPKLSQLLDLGNYCSINWNCILVWDCGFKSFKRLQRIHSEGGSGCGNLE